MQRTTDLTPVGQKIGGLSPKTLIRAAYASSKPNFRSSLR